MSIQSSSHIVFNQSASQYQALKCIDELASPPALNRKSILSPLNQLVNNATKRLRNIDGIDETAASLALIRGLTGPIAAEAVFVGGLPFVVLGLIGMHEESNEAVAAYDELFSTNQTLKNELNLLKIRIHNFKKNYFDHSLQHEIKTIQSSLIAHFENTLQHDSPSTMHPIQRAVEVFCKLNQIQGDLKAKCLERCAAPFGLVAMSGMTAGMIPGITWGGAEIAARVLGQTVPDTYTGIATAHTAAQISSIAGAAISMFFAPANAAMAVYAIFRGYAGVQQHNGLKTFEAFNQTDSTCYTSSKKLVYQYIQADLSRNNTTHRLYGAVTAIAQILLVVSGSLAIASFFGASVTFTGGMAIPIIGAALAIGAALMRIRGEEIRSIRQGETEDDNKNQDSATLALWADRPHKYLTQHNNFMGNFVPHPAKAMIQIKNQQTRAEIEATNIDLARDKLISLIHRAVNQYNQPKQRLAALNRWVFNHNANRGRLIGEGTTLLPETVAQLRKQFANNFELIEQLIHFNNKDEIASRLLREHNFTSNEAIVTALESQGYLPQVLAQIGARITTAKADELQHCPQTKSQIEGMYAQKKLLSLIAQAYQKTNNPEQRQAIVQAKQNQLKSLFNTSTLSFDQRSKTRQLYLELHQTPPNQSITTLQRILNSINPESLHRTLVEAGFQSDVVIHTLVQKKIISAQQAIRLNQTIETDQTQTNQGALLNQLKTLKAITPTAHKGQYVISKNELIQLANSSEWVKNKLAAAAAPVLIKASKNTSKAKLHAEISKLKHVLTSQHKLNSLNGTTFC